MKVLLTGATGLLGSHLLEQILNKGWKVSVLVRSIPHRSYLGQNQERISPTQLNIIDGSLEDAFKVEGNFDFVIHNAALTSANSDQSSDVWKTNFEGTQNLYNQLQGRFGKWIQISSIATMCDGTKLCVSERNFGQARATPYAKSKLAADLWLEQENVDTLFFHPCFMLGAWDSRPSSGAIFHAVKFGKVTTYFDTVKNFVAASDVASGILRGVEKGASGRFILGNENTLLSEFFHSLMLEMNIQNRLNVETINENTSDFVKEFCLTSSVDWEKARLELDYRPCVSLKQMLNETMEYFEKYKMLRRGRSK